MIVLFEIIYAIINNLYADIGRAGYQISKDEKEALELITKKLKGEENNEK